MQTVVMILFSEPEFFNYMEDLGFRVWVLGVCTLRGTILDLEFGIWYLGLGSFLPWFIYPNP